MKKIFIIALAMILILLTCSCDNVKNNNDQTNQPRNESGNDQSNEDKTEKNQTDGTQNENGDDKKSNVASEYGGFYLPSYEEYLEYIENNELPEGFIYYDDIKQFGEFCGLSAPVGIRSDSGAEVYYVYLLSYKGKKFQLVVSNCLLSDLKDPTKDPFNNKDDIKVDHSDMRYTVSGRKGVYYYNNVRYRYSSGHIYDITWYEDGWSYCFNQSKFDPTGYPDNDGSALAKLIYLE